MEDDEIGEILRWQLTGYLLKQAPVVKKRAIPMCHNCGSDWHGLPKPDCKGSFADTPQAAGNKTITDSQ